MALDTVAIAQLTPDNSQPFAELGLKPDEYARIKEILGRRPTSSELAMYSVMWSEHCSYKSSKLPLSKKLTVNISSSKYLPSFKRLASLSNTKEPPSKIISVCEPTVLQ